MVKTVFLEIDAGNFDQGFDAWLQIWQENGLPKTARIQGRLPYNEQLRYMLVAWSESFRILAEDARQFSRTSQVSDIYGVDSVVENESLTEGSTACLKLLQSLEGETNNWLNKTVDRDWLRIREIIREEFAQAPNTTRLVIQSQEPFIWKLPWYSWDLLKRYRNVGVSFCTSNAYRESNMISSRTKPRILAAFGDSSNIDLEVDRKILRKLRSRGADPCFIGHIPQKLSVLKKKLSQLRVFQTRKFSKKPLTSAELISQLRNKKGWDIFFFAGHSWGDKIFINQEESLVVDQFKLAIGEAVSRGLKIAIFNSCNALWLARDLVDLNIPVVIVMQEALPDIVAHRFLADFLENYSSGDSLHIAVRKAQESLEIFSDFPGSSWLPVVFCNPAYDIPTWPMKIGEMLPRTSLSSSRIRLNHALSVSLLIFFLILGVRSVSLLQDLELTSLDYFMQMRIVLSPEDIDERLLIIEINDDDIVNEKGWPIKDETILKALKKVGSYEPVIIGLDVFRDKPSGDISTHEKLITYINDSSLVVPVCKYHKNSELAGASIPEGIDPRYFGFVNVSDQLINFFEKRYDETVIRRYLLAKGERGNNRECSTPTSLAFQMIGYFLNSKDISITFSGDHILAGDIKLNHLTKKQAGGYQGMDDRGHQFLINYRATEQIAPIISLSNVLKNNDIDPNLVKGKVVLIGNTNSDAGDFHFVPYREMREDKREPGVIIHAHVVSQFLSHVLDGRPLLSPLSPYVEGIWIWIWAFFGSFAAWISSKRISRLVPISIIGGAIILNTAISYLALVKGIWLPFVPTFLAFLAATLLFFVVVKYRR